MSSVVTMETGVSVGAAVTLTTLRAQLDNIIPTSGNDDKYRGLKTVKSMLDTFAATQIRNMVTLGGCVTSGWSNSDVVPLLCAMGASITLQEYNKAAVTIQLDEGFYQGFGKTGIQDNQVLTNILLPFTSQGEFVYSLKESRRDFDTAVISTAAVISCQQPPQPGAVTVGSARVVLGNVGQTVIRATNMENQLCNSQVTMEMIDTTLNVLDRDLEPWKKDADKCSLVKASVWRLLLQLIHDTCGADMIPTDTAASLTPMSSPDIKSTQIYEEVPAGQPSHDAVGRPIVHRSARQQATGEAMFMDDTPLYENELHLQFVTSSHAHAAVRHIDPEEALKVEGVVDVITHLDIPGSNRFGVGVKDEPVFAENEVTAYGQAVAAVVATSPGVARRAAHLVNVQYDVLPAIFTIQEAISARSFHGDCPSLVIGDVEAAMATADVVIQGEVETGGQEHFYMETHRALSVSRKENDEIDIFAPNQNCNYMQTMAARILDIPYNKVTLHVKRAGGGFGGKETRLTTMLATAVASYKHKRPVRCVLDRDDDMQMTGGRNPVLAKYKVGVSNCGKLIAVDIQYYGNGGNTSEATPFVMGEVLKTFDNCYRMPNVRLKTYACKTNLPSNTGFRGYGKPQAVFVTEAIMEHIATHLDMDPFKVRETNMYRDGDELPLNCTGIPLTVDRCWQSLLESSQYNQRLEEVHTFNRENKYRKRGLCIGPLKYPLAYPAHMLNQATALVNIYLDGSVLVHHGGMEMGQGLHTKVLQVASRALGIPHEKIEFRETNTDVCNNATVTGGSGSTDIFGGAVMKACEMLVERLKPFKEAKPDGSWTDWVNAAYLARVSLSASGHYKLGPEPMYDFTTGLGNCYSYFSCSAACAEVELDVITGKHVVHRVDIMMDVGKSLNPAIDIGQIEGGFLQGYGFVAMEEVKYRANGKISNSNALGYKIPCVTNVPAVFNVSLLKDAPNPTAVYSSKGVGEPPFLLSYTIHAALRQAVSAYRQQQGVKGHFQMNAPAVPDLMRQLCPR